MNTTPSSPAVPRPINQIEGFPIVTTGVAHAGGYVSVTVCYTPEESQMLRRALRDFQGADALLVAVEGGLEIWRHESEITRGEEVDHGCAP